MAVTFEGPDRIAKAAVVTNGPASKTPLYGGASHEAKVHLRYELEDECDRR
jgi:hypothetical protein